MLNSNAANLIDEIVGVDNVKHFSATFKRTPEFCGLEIEIELTSAISERDSAHLKASIAVIIEGEEYSVDSISLL